MSRRYINGILGLGLMVLALASGAELRAEPAFSGEPTESCVAEARAKSPGLAGHGVLDCVGHAAAECMLTPGGDTTFGMMACLEAELVLWDERLNAAYAARLADAQAQDAEMRALGSAAASIEEHLRSMQRVWVTFRDASCLYEQAQWMGGTGGGPATMACHLQEIARQSLKLEGWWEQ